VAAGALLVRGGDYYGPVVNLAARLAELAIPHEILVTPAVQREAQRTRAPLTFAPAGRRVLKGFAEPLEVFAATRAAASGAAGAGARASNPGESRTPRSP
jgi:class 3 adenylate cyclase